MVIEAVNLRLQMLAHLRTSAYPVYQQEGFPPAGIESPITYASNLERITKRRGEL